MRFFSCIACKRRKSKQVKDVLDGFYIDPCVVELFEVLHLVEIHISRRIFLHNTVYVSDFLKPCLAY